MAGREIHEKIRRRRFWGIFHRTNWWGFYQGVEVGCHRPKLPARFCDSVFSGPEEDGTAHQLSLGGLKSADLEGGFKIVQTIFSAPEKSEYTYIYI